MTDATSRAPLDWSCDQIDKYRALQPRYRQYATSLREVLELAAAKLAPVAIVQTRPKAIASFAEKIQRKWPALNDPVNQLTDLCGGRVITFTQQEVRSVCEFVVQHFEIDWENSVDVSQRLRPAEFGYRSVHYIVTFKPGVFPTRDVDVRIPDEVLGLRAEVQVRTLLEHSWAGFNHDRVYKGAFAVPQKWQRELAGVAAMLEQADEAFSRVEEGLRRYAANYGAYMTEDQMREELLLLESVQACDPSSPDLAHRIGKLAMGAGDWRKAVEVLEKHTEAGYQPILRDLGVSLCKLHATNPRHAQYQRGQQYLQQACDFPEPDADALASLAGTWNDLDPERARGLYRQAFEVAPSYPYAVSNYLAAEIAHRRDTSAIPLMAPAIKAAIQRCNEQAEVGTNLPWAYYDLGTFSLVLGQPYDGLTAYAKAIQLSPDGWFVDTSLRSLRRLEVVRDDLEGYDWMHRLLLIALAGKYGHDDRRSELESLASPGARRLSAPVVILAGGCGTSVEAQMRGYRDVLLAGFADYHGTIIGGGTTAGISGLGGDVGATYSQDVFAVGYISALIPPDVRTDERYGELRRTPGHDFSALEPLQYWADIVMSGIEPGRVRLIGIGGGAIAAAEYRIALALGAQVGIVEGSGRAAGQLLNDGEWNRSGNLTRLSADADGLRRFVAGQ